MRLSPWSGLRYGTACRVPTRKLGTTPPFEGRHLSPVSLA